MQLILSLVYEVSLGGGGELKGRRIQTVEEIEAESQVVLDQLNKKDFVEAFAAWQKCWIRCINVGGDYFEGDAVQNLLSVMKPLVASSSPTDSERQNCCQMGLCSVKKNSNYNIQV